MKTGKKNNCGLCSRSDNLQTYNFALKEIQNTFFTVNRGAFSEHILEDLKICITCAYKIQLAGHLKKNYDQMCNRNNKLTPSKCFFCEDKTDLINISDNPNEIEDKITTFLNFVVIRHKFNDLKACLRCLYSLDIWNEMRRNINKVMNITAECSTTSTETVNNNSPLKNGSRRQKRKLNQTSEVINLSKKRFSWVEYLYLKLKNFQTVDKIIEEGRLNIYASEESYVEDVEDKLFSKLAFVEIFTDSQISKDRIAGNIQESQAENEIIEISDSDNENHINQKQKPQRRKSMLSLKKSSNSLKQEKRTSLRGKQKKLLKFKMPAKVLDKKDVSEPTSVESNSSKEASEYVCDICDKKYTIKCDYLAHSLKHKKTENVVINVLRMHLPAKLNVEELSPQRDRKIVFSSPENINRLLFKWIGENAAKTFEEIDEETAFTKECEAVDQEESNEVNKDTDNETNEDVEKCDDIVISKTSNENETNSEDVSTDKIDTNINKETVEANNTEEELATEKESEIVETENNEARKVDSSDQETPILVNTAKPSEEDSTNNDECNIPKGSKEKDTEDNDTNDHEDMITEDDVGDNDGDGNKEIEEERSKKSTDDATDENDETAEKQNDEDDKSEDEANKSGKEKDEDEFSSSEIASPSAAMSCEDLLNILETDIQNGKSEKNTSREIDNAVKNTSTENDCADKNANAENEGADEDTSVENDSADENASADKNSCAENDSVDKNTSADENSSTGNDNTDKNTSAENDSADKNKSIENGKPEENISTDEGKRKRASDDDEVLPKRKKVRFADEKEVYTPNSSDVQLEKIIENDQLQETEDVIESDEYDSAKDTE